MPLTAEELEPRAVPAVMAPIAVVFHPPHGPSPHFDPSQSPPGYWPAQVRHAYGFDQLSLDGSGQTIAIVDAYDDPNLAADLATFDTKFNLPAPPSFKQVDQNGNSAASVPADPEGGWEVEEALDVEWAHAVAPAASILLVEASSATLDDLVAAVDTARKAPGVVAVSMSWGGDEFDGESAYDSYFTTPKGHGGVTFLAASGDNGVPSGWPAVSSNVLSVGGTTLTLNASDNRASETGWSGSGGGFSAFYAQPGYQTTYASSSYVQNTLKNTVLQAANARGVPDVSYDADPSTGFAVYDSYPYQGPPLGWVEIGGTSASAPQWAALMALVAQGRGAAGPLDGASQTLPALYKLGADATAYPNDFFDITSGNNGQPARVGYDLVTGLGSPRANNLIPDLEHYGLTTTLTVTASTATPTAGAPFSVTVTARNAAGQTLTTYAGTVHFTSTDGGSGVKLPADYTFTAADAGVHTFTNGVTLVTAGNQTITAADTSNTALPGQATVTVGAAAASALSLSAPANATTTAPFSVTVTAKDAYGNTATSYAGTVHFSTSDTAAGVSVPADYPFTAADKGTHTFTNGVTLVTLGNQTVTASDQANALTGSASVNVQTAGPATHFSITVPATATAGSPFSVTVTALGADNAPATGYVGAVHFTTSDKGSGVKLPANYTFTAGDHGTHTFTTSVTLVTAGSQTVTATDTHAASITGGGTLTVNAAAATKLTVTGFPSPVNAGTAGTFTVTAQDAYGNTATGYAGTVAFSSSDPKAQLPPGSTLSQGTGSFSATFQTVGTQSLTATDTVTRSITGTQSGIKVVAASTPTVTGLDPTSGPTLGNFPVMITGTNLGSATKVYFGTTAGYIIGTSATQIGVIAPPHAAGTVDVTVVTPAGTSPTSPADRFTYGNGTGSGPTVMSVTPNSGSTIGGYPVTITGTNFGGAIVVYFGGTAGAIVGGNSTTLQVVAPSHMPGTVDVTVVTGAGTSPVTPADQFTYLSGGPGGPPGSPPGGPPGSSSGPTAVMVNPPTGSTSGGYVVMVSGMNLSGATAVYFGTTPGIIQSGGPMSLQVLVPAHAAGTVDVTVVTPTGTSPVTPGDQFTYVGGAGGPYAKAAGRTPAPNALLANALLGGPASAWDWYFISWKHLRPVRI